MGQFPYTEIYADEAIGGVLALVADAFSAEAGAGAMAGAITGGRAGVVSAGAAMRSTVGGAGATAVILIGLV